MTEANKPSTANKPSQEVQRRSAAALSPWDEIDRFFEGGFPRTPMRFVEFQQRARDEEGIFRGILRASTLSRPRTESMHSTGRKRIPPTPYGLLRPI